MSECNLDYRSLLRDRLEARCRSNPRYSLRAFARDLGVSPSRLSEVLNHKQGLSKQAAEKIGKKLGLSSAETLRFCTQVEATDARSRITRQKAQESLRTQTEAPQYRELDQDTFKVISDWYHFAILELLSLKDFKNDPVWIAKRLGITQMEAKLGLERMIRLDLIAERRGKLHPTGAPLTTTEGIPSDAIRKFNQQILEKALQSITLQSVEERDISTVTASIYLEDLPALHKAITRFRREMNRLMSRPKPGRGRDEVYNLAIQLFRITENR